MAKRILSIFLALMLMSVSFGCDRINEDNLNSLPISVVKSLSDDQICSVGDEYFSYNEALIFVAAQKKAVEEIYTDEIWSVKAQGEESFESILKDSLKEFLVKLFSMKSMSASCEITLSDSEKDKLKNAAGTFMDQLGETALEGVSEEDVYNAFEAYYIYDRLADELSRDLNTEISDNEARVIDIECVTLKKDETDRSDYAKTILSELKSAEDFAKTAKKYNEEGSITRSVARYDFVSDVEGKIFSLEKGQVSSLLEDEDYYYIVRCVNDYDKEATELHKKELIREIKDQNFLEKYNEFMQGVKVRFNDSVWEALSIEGVSTIKPDFFKIYAAI